jgi:hypothetical protein
VRGPGARPLSKLMEKLGTGRRPFEIPLQTRRILYLEPAVQAV